MTKVFSLDDPADKHAFIAETMAQELLYGNVYLTRDGRDVIIWEPADLEREGGRFRVRVDNG